jgi:soluble lytic murein transglycosylase-like protein
LEKNGLIMMSRAVMRFLGLIAFFMLLFCEAASADIYRYRDDKGVWHFTNVKSDKRYTLFLRTYSKKPNQYIKKYEGIMKQAAGRFRVEFPLIKAVIKAESDFDHKAVSHKGAQGLMQLMPDTAQEMRVGDPFNPEENIFGGTRYLGLLLERFQNNKRLALAAYNAGPEVVEAYEGMPPYPETRTFVKRVLYYYDQYNSHGH